MAKPFITVFIDTYNHEQFIEQAVLSVLEQDIELRDIEIIVVDDGSIDNTPLIVRKFVPRVRYIRKSNGGQASAFNIGIAEASGEIVAFLDGDDWWAKEKLQTVLKAMQQNPDVGAIGHGFIEVYPDGRRDYVTPDNCYHLHLHNREGAILFRQLKCFLGTSRLTIRKKVLNQIIPIPEVLIVEADEFIFTIAVAISGAIVLDQPLFYYRLHAGNLFQVQIPDRTKLSRKFQVLAALLNLLPSRLAAVGVPTQEIGVVMEHLWVEVERLRLVLNGGKSWETFRVERAASRLTYKEADISYRLFKGLVLGLTLLMPPRRFYHLKHWYSKKRLYTLRERIGRALPSAPITQRRSDSTDA